jgi:hemoglobin
LIDAFYERVEDDPLLSPFFPRVSVAHREHVAAWWIEVFGGPAEYTAQHGGYKAMLSQSLRPRHHRRAAAAVRDPDQSGSR